MKRITLSLYAMLLAIQLTAQTCDLPISIAFDRNQAEHMSVQTRTLITNKLRQMLTTNGVAGNYDYSQFVLVPHFDLIDKHVVAGPPPKVVMNLSVALEIRQISDGLSLSNYVTEVNAVGNNEDKAYAQGVKQLGNANAGIVAFIDRARQKIIAYYDQNSTMIVNKARALAATHQYDEALFHLMTVPECCTCYPTIVSEALTIYQQLTDREGQQLLMQAQAAWAAGNNDEAARQAAAFLVRIDPQATCYPQAAALLSEIKQKASANAPWNYEMKMADAAISLQQQRIEAAKAIGVAYGNSQKPQTTNLVFAR